MYDATPSIQSVSQSTSSNGSTILTIAGTGFAQSGTVSLCALPGSGPCIQVGGDIRWGAPIAITLTGTLASLLQLISGPPCVTVTTTGITGTFRPAPNGGSVAASPCFALQTADVSLSPTDIAGNPGDVFTFTATGITPSGPGTYSWSLSGENPGAFQFVDSSCQSGSTCAPLSAPDSCYGAQSCTIHLQAKTMGFANLGVSFQTQFASSSQRTALVLAITIQITKVWSDQFPSGPVANYLPADGTPGTGAGAGLVGNTRQSLILGPRQSISGDPVSGFYGFIKANVTVEPPIPQALNHVLVRVVRGIPIAPVPPSTKATAPSPYSPEGLGGANGSVFLSRHSAAADRDKLYRRRWCRQRTKPSNRSANRSTDLGRVLPAMRSAGIPFPTVLERCHQSREPF